MPESNFSYGQDKDIQRIIAGAISPDAWGSHGWKFLHSVTLGYPDHPTPIDKNHYRTFFDSLQYILPCLKCSRNLSEHYQKLPLTDQVLSSKASLVKWGIDLHNIVNYYTNKPLLSYAQAIEAMMQNQPHTETFQTTKSFNWLSYFIIFVVALILIVMIWLAMKKNK
jgi:hypothetical protein